MSKELELWYKIVNYLRYSSKDLKTIDCYGHPTYICSYEGYPLSIIEDALKAVQILKEKKVDISLLMYCEIVDNYNYYRSVRSEALSDEEWRLLRRVLG